MRRLSALLLFPFVLTATAGESSASASSDSFTATISQGAACSVNKPCTLNVAAQAKEGQRMHKPFVISKSTSAPADAKVTAGRSSETAATATLTFTPKQGGRTSVGVTVSACVARGDSCVMEKVDLELDVDVK